MSEREISAMPLTDECDPLAIMILVGCVSGARAKKEEIIPEICSLMDLI